MAESGTPRTSLSSTRSARRSRSLQPIELKDNAADSEEITPENTGLGRSASDAASTTNGTVQTSLGSTKPVSNGHGIRHSRGESIRIALGQGKYKKWSEQEYEEMARKKLKRALSKAGSRTSSEAGRDLESIKDEEKPEEEIDVLYENQRGSFIFGIPLFSSKTLLNFDPSPWTKQDGKDSAVDISNAQLPDPSWQWAWKNWYVDMSGDVDDNGWQYSFSFSKLFSWHGTHVFCNSFVRRRRWVRKRLRYANRQSKRNSLIPAGDDGPSEITRPARDPHHLNPDYFSIHTEKPKNFKSVALKLAVGAGTLGGAGWGDHDDEIDEEDDEITNVPQLMRALRAARLDREKIAAVERFAREGGEEVHYLSERIPAIMNLLVFHSSRRQLVAGLRHIYDSVKNRTSLDEPLDRPPPLAYRNTNLTSFYSPTSIRPRITISEDGNDSQFPSSAAATYSPGISPLTETPSQENSYASKKITATYKQSLKIALESAEASVKKLEFWSDTEETLKIHDHMESKLENEDLQSATSEEPTEPKKWKGKERAE